MPMRVPFMVPAMSATSFITHHFPLSASLQLYAWGANGKGQLGVDNPDEDDCNHYAPEEVRGLGHGLLVDMSLLVLLARQPCARRVAERGIRAGFCWPNKHVHTVSLGKRGTHRVATPCSACRSRG